MAQIITQQKQSQKGTKERDENSRSNQAEFTPTVFSENSIFLKHSVLSELHFLIMNPMRLK